MSNRSLLPMFVASLLSLELTGCGGGGSNAGEPLQPQITHHTLGGTVAGASGPLTLRDNTAATTLAVSGAGTFLFATPLAQGVAYDVVVSTPPTGQTCTVANGAGTMGTINVTNIAVTCTTIALTLGGTVSGLGAGRSVVLQAAADFTSGNVTVNANGPFVFPLTFAPNSEYIVNVLTQPAGQTCTVANGEGDFANTAINNVAVTCVNNSASNRDWHPPSNISTDTDVTDTNGIRTPVVRYDAAGNALAVWAADQIGGSSINLMWSRKPAGGAWSVPAKIPDWIPPPPDPALGEARRFPVLAVAANGNAVAAWRVVSFQGDHVMASTFSPATGWSSPVFLWRKHPDMPSGAVNLRIGMDSAGNTLVVWAAVGVIFYNRHTPGTGWVDGATVEGVGRPVSKLTGPSDEPEMALNAAGQAVAIWRQGKAVPMDLPRDYDLTSSRYDMSTDTWTEPQPVEDGDGDLFFGKSLVIDAAGTATAMWSDFDGTRTHIRASRLVANTWAPPAIVESGNDGPTGFAIFPRAAIDGNGNIMLVWQQGDIDEANFVASRYVPGTVWGGQQNIGTYVGSSSPIFSTEMSVAGNAAGHVVAIWTLSGCVGPENVPCPVDVVANEYNPVNGNWGTEQVIDKDYDFPGEIAGNASTPDVAVDAAGNAVAVWDQDGFAASDGIRQAVFE